MPPQLLYPYPVLDAEPSLAVSNPRLDGNPEASILPRENLVDLFSIEGPWKRVRLRANVQLPADHLEALIDQALEHVVALTVHCAATNLRYAVIMQPDPGRSGSYSAEIELEHAVLAQRARIEAVVAGTVAGVEDRYLARTNVVDVQISELRIPDIAGDLDIAWRRFDEPHEGLPALDPSMHDQLSDLELGRPNGGPRLWLNDTGGYRRLLDQRHGRSPQDEAIRQTLFDGIATSAMQCMFNSAVADARALDEDEGDAWPRDWRGQLLRALLPLMYPERDVEDALALVIQSTDADATMDVQQRAHRAVARHMKTQANAKLALKVLEEEII